jgi:hypothetical protein
MYNYFYVLSIIINNLQKNKTGKMENGEWKNGMEMSIRNHYNFPLLDRGHLHPYNLQ